VIAVIKQLFSATGPLALSFDGYTPRQPQIDMAVAVAQALKNSSQLVVEAGTGTGKTFAYLAPALKSKGRTIISTGSKALQEQLYHRDLPQLVKALSATKKNGLTKRSR